MDPSEDIVNSKSPSLMRAAAFVSFLILGTKPLYIHRIRIVAVRIRIKAPDIIASTDKPLRFSLSLIIVSLVIKLENPSSIYAVNTVTIGMKMIIQNAKTSLVLIFIYYAFLSASTLSNLSHGRSRSVLPKCP